MTALSTRLTSAQRDAVAGLACLLRGYWTEYLPETGGVRAQREIDRTVDDHGMIEEAINAARETLATLCEEGPA